MHVQFVIGIADDFAVPGQWATDAFCFSAYRETFDQLSIDADIQLLRRAHADDVVVNLPAKPNLEGVFAIKREVVADREATARSERQFFAGSDVLLEQFRNGIQDCGRNDA